VSHWQSINLLILSHEFQHYNCLSKIWTWCPTITSPDLLFLGLTSLRILITAVYFHQGRMVCVPNLQNKIHLESDSEDWCYWPQEESRLYIYQWPTIPFDVWWVVYVLYEQLCGKVTVSFWHVAYRGEMRKACKILVRKPEGKRQLRRPRHRWEDIISMYLRK
jgi:hypothetical protein